MANTLIKIYHLWLQRYYTSAPYEAHLKGLPGLLVSKKQKNNENAKR